MIDGVWLKMENTAAKSSMPINFNFSAYTSGSESDIEKLKDYVNIEAYNGSEVQKKVGDLYKITAKEATGSQYANTPVYVEVKDDKIVRVYVKAAVPESSLEVVLDFVLNYDKVEINEPAGAIDINKLNGGKNYDWDDDDDDDDWDDDWDWDDDDWDWDDDDYDFDLDMDDISGDDLKTMMELYEKYSDNDDIETWDAADLQKMIELMNKYN